jgi:hypothetical protein
VRNRLLPGLLVSSLLGACALAALAAAAPAAGQDAGQDEAAPTPRLPDGTVNLGGDGVWRLPWITEMKPRLTDHEEIPYLAWTKAMLDYNKATNVAYDPEGFCLPPGGPRMFGTPYPASFIQDQRNGRIVVIFEGGAHVWREIFMDGRPHPDYLVPTYFGHSIGHWEGDTLVIDTVGFNERTWLNFDGSMHTDELHTIERISRPDHDTLHYEATIDDPGAYSEPWTVAWDIRWAEGEDLQEYICQENNQFLIDLKDDFGEPFFQPSPGG